MHVHLVEIILGKLEGSTVKEIECQFLHLSNSSSFHFVYTFLFLENFIILEAKHILMLRCMKVTYRYVFSSFCRS